MGVFKLNFARIHIEELFEALRVTFESLESHIDIAHELEAERVFTRYREDGADEETAGELASSELGYLQTGVFPRVIRGSLIVSIYAAFEDSIEVLKEVARSNNPSKAPRHLRRNSSQSLEEGCIYYFRESLGYPLWEDDVVESLRLLRTVRHTFAHQAGRLDKNKRKVLRELLTGKEPALHDWPGGLVPTRKYVLDSIGLCDQAVRNLADQIIPGTKAIEFSWSDD